MAIAGADDWMARTDLYQEIFGLYGESGPFCVACPWDFRMETAAVVSGLALGAIDCALSCFRTDDLNCGANRGAATSSRCAWDSENGLVSQKHQNRGGASTSPQLEYLSSSVLMIVFEAGAGLGRVSAASCLAAMM